MHPRSLAALSLALAIGTIARPALAEDLVTFSMADGDVRSLPALGFFPLGGDLRFSSTDLLLYAGGPSIDFLNVNREKSRISLLNLSGYLFGLNIRELLARPDLPTNYFNLAYVRVGPHWRMEGLLDENTSLAFGGQLGYGAVARGNTEEATTRIQHGVDISMTLSWGKYRQSGAKVQETPLLAGLGLTALGLGGTAYGFGTALAPGSSTTAYNIGITTAVLSMALVVPIGLGIAFLSALAE